MLDGYNRQALRRAGFQSGARPHILFFPENQGCAFIKTQ